MELNEVDIGSLVCFRWNEGYEGMYLFLMCKLTPELVNAYYFAHSEPYTSEKGNREPIFPEAVYEKMETKNPIIESLMRTYDHNSKRKDFKCKIINHDFYGVLE